MEYMRLQCTSCTENKNDINLFSGLILTNRQGEGRKSYMIDIMLTTLVNEHNFDEEYYLKLARTSKAACLVEGYTLHSNQSGMGIPTSNTKLNKLRSHILRDEQARLQNVKIIFL